MGSSLRESEITQQTKTSLYEGKILDFLIICIDFLTKLGVFSVFREQAITPRKRTAIFLPLKLGIEQAI